MRGSTRARVHRRRLTTIITALTAAVGVQLALTATAGAARASQAAQNGTATLTVEVNGLPRKVHGNVKLTGPGKSSRRITTTTTLKNVASGSYTVTAQTVVSGAKTYHPTVTLCSASGRCSSPSRGHVVVKSHQRVTVRVTYAVAKPKSVGTAPTPASPGGSPQPSPGGTLAGGKSETGGWSATISVPAGGPQTQAAGVVSYPIELAERPIVVYRGEREAESPVFPCEGNVNNPLAQPGYLCVYRSGNFGSLETQDKNAKFFGFQDFNGNNYAKGSQEGGLLGELVVFRTAEFNAEHPTTLVKEAALTAAGSWAVTAK